MQSIIHSRIAAIGVAALLSTSCLVAADAPALTATWDAGTTSKNDDVSIKIGGKLQAAIFGYDAEKKYVTSGLNNTPVTNGPQNTKATHGMGDGVGMEDAELQISGTAYKHVTFGMRYDVANSSGLKGKDAQGVDVNAAVDKNFLKVDKWWIGLTDIPYVGEITVREVDEHFGFANSDVWIEDTVIHNFFGNNGGSQAMVGVKWMQKVKGTGIAELDDRLTLWAAAGLISNEIGTTNKDWTMYASACYQAVKADDNLNAYVKFDAGRQDIAEGGGTRYTQNATMYAGKTSQPVLGVFSSDKTDNVLNFCPSVAATYRFIGANAQYYLAKGDAMNAVNGVGGKDFTLSGWNVNVAVALTGENETNTLGIKKPKKALKGDNLLENFGALELVARVSMLDASDKDYKATSMATYLANQNANPQGVREGVDVTEYQIGLNWYPTGNMLVGLMYSLDQFKANATGAEEYSASMFGVRTLVKF